MSVKASEIITSMTTTFRQQMIELFNQNINDMQAIVSRMEERIVALQLAVARIEQRLDEIEAGRERGV